MKSLSICVLTFTMVKAGSVPLSNLLSELRAMFREVYLILVVEDKISKLSLNDKFIHVYTIEHKGGGSKFTRIVKVIKTQLIITYTLIRLIGKIDLIMSFMGGELLLVPLSISKLFHKKIFLLLAASSIRMTEVTRDSFHGMMYNILKFDIFLSDGILIYSNRLIDEWGLRSYMSKIRVIHEHFVDFDIFKKEKCLGKRSNTIGYIGRLSKEKGILNFAHAIPQLLKEDSTLCFFIGGDGPLKEDIILCLAKYDLGERLTLSSWIPHEDLPRYLNNLKLLVLPSYTEGLPNIILEAMACGTPVLATAVGAIPDLIKDGETGFLMDNNSPECITDNIIRAVNYPCLEKVAENARIFVGHEFTYESTVDRWNKLFIDILR